MNGKRAEPAPRAPADDHLVELEVGEVAAGGGCVARGPDGRVVFVRHSLPGERVLARVTQETTSYRRADAVEVLDASPDRVPPPCKHAGPGRCGGCDWQHVTLATQRAWKGELIKSQLLRVAGLDRPVEVEEVPGSTDGLGWRTRVRFAVDSAGAVGLRRHRSHRLELIGGCLIASDQVEGAGAEGLSWGGVEEFEVCSSPNEETTMISVTTRRGRRAAIPSVPGGLVVDGKTRRSPDRLRFEVLGRNYAVSAGVFWQVHPGAATTLAQAVLECVDPQPGDRIVDLFSGAGLFSALLGERVGASGSVMAVERDVQACADATANTTDLPWVEVRRGNVGPELVAQRIGDPHVVVLDPAREGAGRAVMAALAAKGGALRQIVYVSCDPATFARDVRVMLDGGWRLASLRAFDLFPMTEHVELLGVLVPPPA